MKYGWLKGYSLIFIVIGLGLLLFVLRMVLFPPSSLGMMMGKDTMLHHVIILFVSFFLILLISLLTFAIVKKISNRGK